MPQIFERPAETVACRILDSYRSKTASSRRWLRRRSPVYSRVVRPTDDREYLIRFLYELSLRDDIYYVKYSTRARDGMYLGRCFLETDEDAAMLCQDLKAHPKFLVVLQDDEFFAAFRSR